LQLTFTLMGVPAVEVSAIPMLRQLPNILDLPLVSRFVRMAIAAGTASLCAPNSMTLSIKDMLSGAAVGDTRAAGVFLITIHHAEGLSAQDSNGKSDPYIVLAYAKVRLYTMNLAGGNADKAAVRQTPVLDPHHHRGPEPSI
jgi:Ca2+-dependent lipid-binding protein